MTAPSSSALHSDAGEPRAGQVLVVDLDGTLVGSDLLHESFWAAAADTPKAAFGAVMALQGGKAGVKEYLAERVEIDAATLPYNPEIIDLIETWRAEGGRTALVTASNQRFADAIAEHLGLFDDVLGSSDTNNLAAEAKAAKIVERYGSSGVTYVGDSSHDLAVWAATDAAITVGASRKVRSALSAQQGSKPTRHLAAQEDLGAGVLRALRPHQWAKNVLVFVPMIADLQLSAASLWGCAMAMLALSLVASAGYVLNDLLDLPDDRSHPRKRLRPFASGQLSAATGTALVPLLLLGGLLVAALISPLLAGAVALYFISTLAYSVSLKRYTMVDICMLATLFTLRIIAGGVAIGATLSVWVLAFSMFIFFSLAAIKRLAELTDAEAADRAVSRRGYKTEDVSVLSQMSIAAGYLSVLVLAFYIDAPVVQEKFSTPWLLWGVCPLLIFWISRLVLIANRGHMHDDPLVFALRNKTSRWVIVLSAALVTGGVVI